MAVTYYSADRSTNCHVFNYTPPIGMTACVMRVAYWDRIVSSCDTRVYILSRTHKTPLTKPKLHGRVPSLAIELIRTSKLHCCIPHMVTRQCQTYWIVPNNAHCSFLKRGNIHWLRKTTPSSTNYQSMRIHVTCVYDIPLQGSVLSRVDETVREQVLSLLKKQEKRAQVRQQRAAASQQQHQLHK